MKKVTILALALVFVLAMAATALAAANPFVDVPANHWAYKAIATLAKDGVINGFPDGTYQGDKNMTRYEMAEIVGKAVARADKASAADKALIDKLSAEFSAELNNLGVKVSKLQSDVNGRVYLTGEVILRYDNYQQANGDGNDYNGSNNMQKLFRTELAVNGTVNDSWKYYALLRNDKFIGNNPTYNNVNGGYNGPGVSADSTTNNYVQFRQAYVQGNLFGLTTTVGRQPGFQAYGLVFDQDITGIGFQGGGDVVKFNAQWGNADNSYINFTQDATGHVINWNGTAPFGQVNINWWAAGLKAKFSPTFNARFAYMVGQSQADATITPLAGGTQYQTNGAFLNSDGSVNNQRNFWELGADWTFAKDWKLTGIYAASNANDQNTGYRAQVDWKNADINTPGSYHAWLAYSNVQAWSTYNSTFQNIPGYNNFINWGNGATFTGFYGARGWEVGVDYVWAKNIQMHSLYNNYNSTTGNNASSKMFRTDFYFYF